MRKVTIESYRKDKYYPKITKAVGSILERKNHVTPIDLFSEMDLLDESDLVTWKKGQVPYLEKVIHCNLAKASRILRIFRFHAHDCNLRPSMTVYKYRTQILRFTKSGEKPLEEAYARHFIATKTKGTKYNE